MDIKKLQNHLVGLPLFADKKPLANLEGGGVTGVATLPFKFQK